LARRSSLFRRAPRARAAAAEFIAGCVTNGIGAAR